MSFEADILTIMNADSSLNSMVDHIFPKRIRDGVDEQEDSVLIYVYKKSESENNRSDMNFLTRWELGVYVGSKSNAEVINISNRVQDYLENYKGGNVSLIGFVDDDPDYDEEEDIHFNDMYFYVIYQ